MACKPLVYVAGPISSDLVGNARTAVNLYIEMLKADVVIPFCPHLSVLAEMMAGPTDYEMWMAHDFEVIARCDALLRMDGDSPGADREIEHARSLDIPVFYNTKGLYEWASWQTEARGMRKLSLVGSMRRLHSVDT